MKRDSTDFSKTTSACPPPQSRRRLGHLGAAACVALACTLFATPALASKEALDYVSLGKAGDPFANTADTAANSSGAGPAEAGDFYVADPVSHRIQRFDSEGGLLGIWGADVHGINERQTFQIRATGGTYTLEFEGETTDPLSHNAQVAKVREYLEALPTIGKENVVVSDPGGVTA